MTIVLKLFVSHYSNQNIANCVSTSNHTEVQPTSELNPDLIDVNTELTNHPQHTCTSPS